MKMKSLNHVPWPVLISLLIGCGETDPRVAQVALESTRRQAEQNRQMGELQQHVAEGTKQLVEASTWTCSRSTAIRSCRPTTTGPAPKSGPAAVWRRCWTCRWFRPRRTSCRWRRRRPRRCCGCAAGPAAGACWDGDVITMMLRLSAKLHSPGQINANQVLSGLRNGKSQSLLFRSRNDWADGSNSRQRS